MFIMKKFLLILALIFSTTIASADLMLQGEAQFDWVDISQVQRDENIDFYRNAIFGEEEPKSYKRKEFKEKYTLEQDKLFCCAIINSGLKEV